jgi:hypothetical protein
MRDLLLTSLYNSGIGVLIGHARAGGHPEYWVLYGLDAFAGMTAGFG